MSHSTPPTFTNLTIHSPSTHPHIHIIRMNKPPENRLTIEFCQELIRALRYIETTLLGASSPGAVVISSFSTKFFCTGLDLNETESNAYANSDGFFPLLATLLDYPYPTVAAITGHTFGGACPFALACDYRVMNGVRGYFSMPPVDLGLHFEGIGALPRLKLGPGVARRMLLEAYKWTGKEALRDGIVDVLVDGGEGVEAKAVEMAERVKDRAKMGVYGLLRTELWGEALGKIKGIAYVHRMRTGTAPKAKI